MEAIVSIVLAGLLFRERGTRTATRGFVVLTAFAACLYDSPPLHHLPMARIWTSGLALTVISWLLDLRHARRGRAGDAQI